MRSKEDALDYRYFPEPDMPQLRINDETLKRLSDQEVQIPYATIKTFKEYGFNKEYINALIGDKDVLHYFNAMIATNKDAKQVAKRIC